MKIIECKKNIFVLDMKNTHYVVGVDEFGRDRLIHWGKKCDADDYEIFTFGDENSNHTSLDEMKQECTVFGKTMYRECVLKANFYDSCREINSCFCGATVENDRLTLNFKDEHYGLVYSINYRIFSDCDIVEKNITVKNESKNDIQFERLFSAEFSLPSKNAYTFSNTNGAWGGEFIETNDTLTAGSLVFDSKKGASCHNNSPYFIAYQNADEHSGDVYFASLAYSGNFKVIANRDLYSNTRVLLGMNDFDFSYLLKSGESFTTPCVYAGYTQGFGEMSRQMNTFAVNHLLPRQFNDKVLPVLYNSWEATEFNINVSQQLELAKIASDLGVELFVMDDGWFGKRNNDRAGLGDWTVNQDKFPNGLDELIDGVNALGMDFGIWVEPEMVNPDSELYRTHPDWAYHYDTRVKSELRHQLVLNMTRADVQEYVFDCVDKLLSEHNIQYIKWDMNRPFSETGAENLNCPKMLYYLHTKAVYDIVDRLKEKHCDVQFEACASGGGRADLGALSHFDQCWTSDNTDGIDRMSIQHGYSLLRPIKAMRAWVTDIAGINKPCTLDFRFNIAMQGALGLGGNLLKYSDDDKEISKKNIALYKAIRHTVQFGDLYRVSNPDENEVLINVFVERDKSSAVAFIASRGTRFFKKRINILFDGLEKDAKYRFTFQNREYIKSGAYMANVGIPAHIHGAYYNEIVLIDKLND